MLVTLAGYDIMRGRALLIPTNANDFAHEILARLGHRLRECRGRSRRRETARLVASLNKMFLPVPPAFVGGACALLFWTGLIEALDY